MMKKLIYVIFASVLIASRSYEEEADENLSGDWRGILTTQGGPLPFNFSIVYSEDTLERIDVVNAEEVIPIRDISWKGDSLFLQFPVFDTRIIAKSIGSDSLAGWWYDYSRGKNYRLNFYASKGKKFRFLPADGEPAINISGMWQTVFSPQDEYNDTLLGKFDQQGNQVSGTFLSTTGDYRFLDGAVTDDSLYLSTFDGAHAYLLKASVKKPNCRNVLFRKSF